MIYTIGFSNKPARTFFQLLRSSRATSLVDVRLNPLIDISGFAQGDNLAYFLNTLCALRYVHEPLLAPTKDMLDDYMTPGGSWDLYEQRFLNLMRERHVETRVSPDVIDDAVLLCSEEKPDRCHRRLVAEYLSSHWSNGQVRHIT